MLTCFKFHTLTNKLHILQYNLGLVHKMKPHLLFCTCNANTTQIQVLSLVLVKLVEMESMGVENQTNAKGRLATLPIIPSATYNPPPRISKSFASPMRDHPQTIYLGSSW